MVCPGVLLVVSGAGLVALSSIVGLRRLRVLCCLGRLVFSRSVLSVVILGSFTVTRAEYTILSFLHSPFSGHSFFAYSESKLTFHFVVVRRKVEKDGNAKKVPFTIARVFKLCIHIDQDTLYRW